jgi:hypothetical protein
MTLSEAITVMKIMATTDDWCSTCGQALIGDFVKAFPKFKDVALTKEDVEKLKIRYREVKYENIDKGIWETNVWNLK